MSRPHRAAQVFSVLAAAITAGLFFEGPQPAAGFGVIAGFALGAVAAAS